MTVTHPSIQGARANLRSAHAFARLWRAVPTSNEDIVSDIQTLADRASRLAAEAQEAGMPKAAAIYRDAARVEEWTLRSALEHPDGVPPIWDRQARPKPPGLHDVRGIAYARNYRRCQVLKYPWWSLWTAWSPGDANARDFCTFAEAIAYADREARR